MTLARIQTAFTNPDGSPFNGYMVTRLTKTIVTVEAETVVRQEWDFTVKDGQAYNDAAGTDMATHVVTESGAATPGNVSVSIWQKSTSGKMIYWGTVIVPAETGGLPVVLGDLAPVAPDEPVTYQAVRTFNLRAGDVTLTGADVNTALTYTAADVAAVAKPRGAWGVATAYAVNDVVKHDGSWWVALGASTGQTPAVSSAFWEAYGGHLTASPADLRTPYQALEEANVILPCLRLLVGELETVQCIRDGSGAVTSALANGRAFPITRTGGLITRVGGLTALPALTRATVAYNQDGSQVAAGAMRYRYGRNLAFESDLAARGTGVTVLDGARSKYGLTARRVTMGSTVQADWGLSTPSNTVTGKVGAIYTVSIDAAQVSGGTAVQITMMERSASGTLLRNQFGTSKAIGTSLGRISQTFAATGADTAYLHVVVTGLTANQVFEAVGIQVEETSAATDWTEGGLQGAFIEDGTMNLVGEPIAATGFPSLGAVRGDQNVVSARVTTTVWSGTYSVRIDTTTTASTDRSYQLGNTAAMNGLVAGQTYTFSSWVYVPSGTGLLLSEVTLRFFDYDGATYSDTPSSAPTAFDTWQRLTVTKTLRAGATAAFCRVKMGNAAISGIHMFFDGVQVEQKPYATSLMVGTRNPDLLTAPIAGLMKAAEGTLSFRFKMDVVKTSDHSIIIDAGGSGVNGFFLSINTAGKLNYGIGDGNAVQSITGATTLVAGTDYEATISWSVEEEYMELFLSGISEGSKNVPIKPVLYSDFAYLGSMKNNSTRYLNGTIYHARAFDEKQTTATIALFTPTYRPSIWPTKQIAVLDFEGSLAYRAKTATLAWAGGYPESITAADELIAA